MEDKELEEKATQNREANENIKGRKANAYSHANTQALINDEPSKGVLAADFAIDSVPLLLSFLLGKGAKKTPAYKRAKLREAADMTDYSMTGPDVLTYVEGTTQEPYGQLSRAIKHYYGNDEKKEVTKSTKKGIWEAAKSLKKKNPKITDDDIVEMIEMVRTGNTKDLDSETADLIKNAIMKNRKNYSLAQDIVDSNIETKRLPNNKVAIEINSQDKLASAMPTALKTTGALLEAGNIADKAWKLKDYDPLNALKDNEKGLQPTSPFFTVTELLDGLTDGSWRYNKKEAIDAANNLYDEIMQNGTDAQKKEAIDIYANTDFNKKKEAVWALKGMLKLKSAK